MPKLRSYWVSAVLAASPLLPRVVSAQPASPVRVLFVGNSFTHGKFDPVRTYNSASVTDENASQPSSSPRCECSSGEAGPWGGIPGIFKKLTDQAGLLYEVHLEAISGQNLQYHYANALGVDAQAGWNQVVLQEQSTGPLPSSRGGNRGSFYAYATRLEQAQHQATPTTRVYLYETWARADKTYPSGQPYSGLPIDSMQADLQRGYYAEYRTNGHFAGVAPAGEAWLRAIGQGVATRNPYRPEAGKLNLWGPDYFHPSKWGSYLNALVLFYTLTGVDPRTLGGSEQASAELGITPTDAAALQQLAYEQVASAPLPVELVAFTARLTDGSTVALAWTTASELRSARFEVERSTDGEQFAVVGEVAAASSSATRRAYTYADTAVPVGSLYYRLRQVDTDGRATYSPVRAVVRASAAGSLLLYPNPAAPGTTLAGVAPGSTVRVVDGLGRVVLTATADATGTLLLPGLATGQYVVQSGAGTARFSVGW